MSSNVRNAPPLASSPDHPARRPGASDENPTRSRMAPWPQSLVSVMRQHLSVGICDGILERCATQGEFAPRDWKTSSRRKALVTFLCARSAIFMPEAQVALLRESLDLASYSAWRRSDSAKLQLIPSRRARPAPSDRDRRAPLAAGRQALRITVPVSAEGDVLSARTRALSVAKQAGASLFVRTRIATLVSELARRIHQQGDGGQLELRVERDQLVVVSRDEGPAIEDLDEVLAHPEQHRLGPNAALVACQSLAVELEIISQPQMGTTITAKLALG